LENETVLDDFLKSNGFKLIENDSSPFFGDYFDVYSNGEISIKLGSSKSLKTQKRNLKYWSIREFSKCFLICK
jgi:hypothetical protein